MVNGILSRSLHPCYDQIRLEYGSKLFSRFGDNLQSAIRSLTWKVVRKVPDFMIQEPTVVARFVAKCLHPPLAE
jgi:hypothetical protein